MSLLRNLVVFLIIGLLTACSQSIDTRSPEQLKASLVKIDKDLEGADRQNFREAISAALYYDYLKSHPNQIPKIGTSFEDRIGLLDKPQESDQEMIAMHSLVLIRFNEMTTDRLFQEKDSYIEEASALLDQYQRYVQDMEKKARDIQLSALDNEKQRVYFESEDKRITQRIDIVKEQIELYKKRARPYLLAQENFSNVILASFKKVSKNEISFEIINKSPIDVASAVIEVSFTKKDPDDLQVRTLTFSAIYLKNQGRYSVSYKIPDELMSYTSVFKIARIDFTINSKTIEARPRFKGGVKMPDDYVTIIRNLENKRDSLFKEYESNLIELNNHNL